MVSSTAVHRSPIPAIRTDRRVTRRHLKHIATIARLSGDHTASTHRTVPHGPAGTETDDVCGTAAGGRNSHTHRGSTGLSGL
jgi:hypothetical protein